MRRWSARDGVIILDFTHLERVIEAAKVGNTRNHFRARQGTLLMYVIIVVVSTDPVSVCEFPVSSRVLNEQEWLSPRL